MACNLLDKKKNVSRKKIGMKAIKEVCVWPLFEWICRYTYTYTFKLNKIIEDFIKNLKGGNLTTRMSTFWSGPAFCFIDIFQLYLYKGVHSSFWVLDNEHPNSTHKISICSSNLVPYKYLAVNYNQIVDWFLRIR